MSENIYLSILLAAIATYLCRASGVVLSKKLNVNSSIFTWIEYISMGIIISVITKIIFFPMGILNETSIVSRILSIIILLLTYYSTNKNTLFSLMVSIIFFTLITN